MSEWICYLIELQNLIIGLIGFSGVIFTLWFNARFSRFQRLEEREHDRKTLRIALIEELKINLSSLNESSKLIGERQNSEGFVAPTIQMNEVYINSVNHIRLLSKEEIRNVLRAYLILQTYYSKLYFLGNPSDISNKYVIISTNKSNELQRTQKSVMLSIDKAINTLSKYVKSE